MNGDGGGALGKIEEFSGKPIGYWSPNVGPWILHRKVWRWEVIGGLSMMQGFRNGAELGVATGRFTVFLCTLIPDMHMTCVDLWAAQPDNEAKGSETYIDRPHERSYQHFKKLCAEIFPGRVKIIRDWTANAAKLVDDGSLDFVFVDADHSYEACAADIRDWTPKVRKGGVMAGHDFSWPGVGRAVKETGKYVLGGDDTWMRLI